jgi:hypothetical protein
LQLNNLRAKLTPDERRELIFDESVSPLDRGAISLAANFAGRPPRSRWETFTDDSQIIDDISDPGPRRAPLNSPRGNPLANSMGTPKPKYPTQTPESKP